MKNIAIEGQSFAGGALVPTQSFFKINSKSVIRNGDIVLPHGVGIHSSANVISMRFFTCLGVPVTATTDLATCSHVVSSGEFPTVQV